MKKFVRLAGITILSIAAITAFFASFTSEKVPNFLACSKCGK